MTIASGPKPGDVWNHMTVVASGGNRVCVIDRRNTQQCLKFMLPLTQRKHVGPYKRMQRRRAQRKPIRDDNHAEFRAWMQLSSRIAIADLQLHLAPVLDLFRTIYGPALCCQRITQPNGHDAISLYRLLHGSSRYTAQALCQAVDEFEQWQLRHRIPLFNLNSHHLLALPTGTGVRLICIDTKSMVLKKGVVPLSHWFSPLGKRKIKRQAERLRTEIQAARVT